MFLTPCYNNFTYVYKYACLVKLKYLEYLVNWTCTRPYFKSIPQPFAIAVRVYRHPPRQACSPGRRGINDEQLRILEMHSKTPSWAAQLLLAALQLFRTTAGQTAADCCRQLQTGHHSDRLLQCCAAQSQPPPPPPPPPPQHCSECRAGACFTNDAQCKPYM